MVDCARLESVYARKGIEGSNPSLSVSSEYVLAVSCKPVGPTSATLNSNDSSSVP